MRQTRGWSWLLFMMLAGILVTTGSPSFSTGPRLQNAQDGSILLLVPAGSFTMGSSGQDEAEKPAHVLTLPAYYMGRCPVTNAQYRRFVTVTGHVSEAHGDWKFEAEKWGEKAPVVDVTWDEAQAYCHWAHLRLPTEAEWEKAARGTDGRKYPWGNQWDIRRTRYQSDGPGSVGTLLAGASPFGCMDMSGSVWQWCSSKYQPYPYNARDGREGDGDANRVMRGGSFYGRSEQDLTVSCRGFYANHYDNFDVGFRVARDL